MVAAPSDRTVSSNRSWKSIATSVLVWFVVIVGVFLTSLQVVLEDTTSLDRLCWADFTQFYVAGVAVREKDDLLYPPVAARHYVEQDFQDYAQKLFPTMTLFAGNFLYPPAMAVLYSAFARIPFRTSYLVWQGLSLLALIASSVIFSKAPSLVAVTKPSWIKVVLASMSFLMVAEVLVIGQQSLVFGLLPLCAGYYFWQKQKPFLAGLCWSVLSMKPQLAIPAGMISLAWCFATSLRSPVSNGLRESDSVAVDALAQSSDVAAGSDRQFQWRYQSIFKNQGVRMLCAMAVGTAVNLAIGVAFLGPEQTIRWLHALQLWQAHIASAEPFKQSYWHLCSAASVLMVTAPPDMRAALRLPVNGIVFLLCCVEFGLLIMVARSALAPMVKRASMIIIALCSLPLTSIYMCTCDYVVCLLPAWIVFTNGGVPPARVTRIALIFACLAMNVYYLMMPIFGAWRIFNTAMQTLIFFNVCVAIVIVLTHASFALRNSDVASASDPAGTS